MKIIEIEMESRDIIREIITRRGISARHLSNQIGIAEQSVSKMLKGKLTLTDTTLAKMAKELSIPFELAKYGEGLEEYLNEVGKTTSIHQHGRKNLNQAIIGNNNTSPAGASGSIADELIKLLQLRDAGALTEEEFQLVKKKLLS